MLEKMELARLRADERGNQQMHMVMGLIIALAVGMYMVAYLFVPAMTELNATDISSWTSGHQGIFPLVGLFGILAIALVFIYTAIDRR